MKNLIAAINESLESKNYYAALFMALTIPDICGKLEYPEAKTNKERYYKWVENNLFKYYRIICMSLLNRLNSTPTLRLPFFSHVTFLFSRELITAPE